MSAPRRRKRPPTRLCLAAACLLAPHSGLAAGGEPAAEVEARYARAIADAAVFRADHRRGDLAAITRFPAAVVTWTKLSPSEHEIATVGIYGRTAFRRGEVVLADEAWVTAPPEVRERCRSFARGDLVLRLEQLLGLPPIPPQHAPDVFVTLSVPRREDLFRPCTDPDPGTPGPCTAGFPDGVPAEHVAWVARQALASWRVPGGFPWTRLGYTYDWGPGASPFGPSEFVVRKGARVEVTAVTPTGEYCRPDGS